MGNLLFGARKRLATEGTNLLSCGKCAAGATADVGAVVHAFEANLRNGGVSSGKCGGQIRAKGRDPENATAARDGVFALTASAGMKDLYTCLLAQTG
jgi:hypothetical protein